MCAGKMSRKAIFSLVLVMLFSISIFPLNILSGGVVGYSSSAGLVGYWNFDQGSGITAYDSSGYNNHGTIYGASWTSGKVNGALSFDGVDDYVNCGNSATLDPTQEATIEAWVYFDVLPSNAGHIMEIAARSGPGADLDLQAETDNRFKFFVGTGVPNVAVSNTVIEANKWYHVAGTYQANNNVKIYVNGVLDGTTVISITRNSNPNNFSIGESLFWRGRFFKGKIDEVKIYNRALSEEEISAEAGYIQASISPSSKVMDVGQSQQFTSNISGGTPPYTYQWYLNGTPVSGATNASWTFTAETPGSYTVYVIVRDATLALGKSNTATVTVNPLSATTVVTVSNNSAKADQTAKTGVSIVVSGSSLQNGAQLNITSTNYGNRQPEDTGPAQVDAIGFYGIRVILMDGALGSDVSGEIKISNSRFSSTSVMKYWNGTSWISVVTKFTAPYTVSGTIPSSALAGSTIMVGISYSHMTYSDDFSTDSGMWKYLGSAHRDPGNQYLVLTEPIPNQAGVAFLNITFTNSFIANFSFKAGGEDVADGFAMFFYKQNYSSFASGGYMAFSNPPTIYPGYGIEFDTFLNDQFNDPSDNHIALIKDNVNSHLIYANDPRVKDNAWHNVSVEVENSSVEVFLDQNLIFQWNGNINRTYNYFGFCGATGAATNLHIIDNFSIKILSPITYYNITISTNYGGTTNPAPGTYTCVNGTSFEAVAVPGIGYSFDRWLLDGQAKTENPIAIVMDANHTLKAYFVDDIHPEIGDPIQNPLPDNVQPFQNVTVTVTVFDYGTGVRNVTLWYSINNGTTWTHLNMINVSANAFQAVIPGYQDQTWLIYKIIAYDNAENMAVEDNNGYYYKYHVIPEFPSAAILMIFMILSMLTIVLAKKRR